MNKTRFAYLLAVLLPMSVIAQDAVQPGRDKGYLGLGFGVSLPMGDFESSSFDNEHAGFAATGWLYEISFAYKFIPNFGVAATIRGMRHAFDEDAVTSLLNLIQPGPSYTMTSDPWNTNCFLGGAYLSFPVSKKATFDVKLLGGVSLAESPVYRLTINDGLSTQWVAQKSGNGSGFAWLLGIGTKVDLNSKVCLLLQADYLGTDVTLDDVESASSSGYMFSGDIDQTIQTFNFSAGIGFRL